MSFLQAEALNRLTQAIDGDRLAHAYLIVGARGSGKNDLISHVVGRLLNVESSVALQHVDVHIAEPESRSRRILIEPIRRLEKAIRSGSSAGGRKIAIIREADRLQPQAANAFLKTLEEPPAGAHIFLTSSLPSALLDTIISRCIVVQLRSSTVEPLSPTDAALLDRLEEIVLKPTSPTADSFRLARTFLDLLAAERDAIREEFLTAFKEDQKHYKQTTDGAWLDDREEQIKSLTEAAALRRRAELLHTVGNWFTDVLRLQHGAKAFYDRPAISQAAQSLPTKTLLRRIDTIESMTGDLALTVQEPVAIEAGFLRLFRV